MGDVVLAAVDTVAVVYVMRSIVRTRSWSGPPPNLKSQVKGLV
ncbi:hypothetical protein [Streptomyces sp. KLMMK]